MKLAGMNSPPGARAAGTDEVLDSAARLVGSPLADAPVAVARSGLAGAASDLAAESAEAASVCAELAFATALSGLADAFALAEAASAFAEGASRFADSPLARAASGFRESRSPQLASRFADSPLLRACAELAFAAALSGLADAFALAEAGS